MLFVFQSILQEYNELQHLRIMESLGGDTRWSDRFFARHAAFVYFWVLTLVREGSPPKTSRQVQTSDDCKKKCALLSAKQKCILLRY